MEKEKLIIKNFGPIKHVELELGRFNVLIGEQGTGKSTIGKILAIFRNDLFIQESFFNKFLENYNIDSFLEDDTEIFYKCSDYSVTYKKDIKIVFFDSELERLINSIVLTRSKWLSIVENDSEERLVFEELIKLRSLFDKGFYSGRYIPSERTLIGSNDELIRTKKEDVNYQFNYLTEFNRSFKNAKSLNQINFLGWNFERDDNFWYLLKSDKKIRLKYASSGIQSIFPLGLNYMFNSYAYGKLFFIIEEPEQNLYPTTQYEVIKFLAFASYDKEHKKLLTTHSPYILTSLNNLMYAWQVGQKNEEEVSKIIDKKYWVNPAEVSAYQLLSDGTAKNIIADDGLIMSEQIDTVSEVINKEYNDIFNIEYKIEN